MDKVYSHAGDYGDLIYQIIAIQLAGGGDLILHPHGRTRATMTQAHANGIIPLLECQPYIHKVWWQGFAPRNAIALDGWRETHHRGLDCNLQHRALHYLRMRIPDQTVPWLFIPEPKRVAGTIFHRSNRRHNPQFNWDAYHTQYGADAAYIGTGDDCKFKLPFHDCKNLLEAAQVIAGADRFIGNQSCPLAIAEGLKKPLVCEMYDHSSVPFQRPDAQYGPPPPPKPAPHRRKAPRQIHRRPVRRHRRRPRI